MLVLKVSAESVMLSEAKATYLKLMVQLNQF